MRLPSLLRPRTAAVVVLSGLLVGVGVSGAVAGDVRGGEWWFEDMGVAEVQGLGASGAGVSVAVIDGPVDPGVPVFEGVDLRVREPSFCVDDAGVPVSAVTSDVDDGWHGTNVAGFVARVVPEATILYYSVDGTGRGNDVECWPAPAGDEELYLAPDEYAQAVRAAVDDGADVISMSITASVRSEQFQDSVAWALSRGVVVVLSLGEMQGDHRASDNLATTNGVVAVEALDVDLEPLEGVEGSGEPVSHEKVTVVAPGVSVGTFGDRSTGDWSVRNLGIGTSFATPITAGAVAAVWSAYPDATGNQMLQSLIHNTDVDDHELFYSDTYGYGVLGLRHMLRTDPTQYEDVNPLLLDVEDDGFDITPEQVASATRPVYEGEDGWVDPDAPTPTEKTRPSGTGTTAGPVPSDGSGVPGWVWVGAAGALGLTVLAVAITLLATRRRAPIGAATGGGPGPGHGHGAGVR